MTYRSVESILVRDNFTRGGCENALIIAVGLGERFRLDALGLEVLVSAESGRLLLQADGRLEVAAPDLPKAISAEAH